MSQHDLFYPAAWPNEFAPYPPCRGEYRAYAGGAVCDKGRGVISIELLITNPLLKSCEEALDERYKVHRLYDQADPDGFLKAHGANIRAIASGKVDVALMDKLPNLEIIANFGVGYDPIDVVAAKQRNIRVTNTPDVLNDAMAEITIGLMVSMARRLPQADQYVRAGKWPDGAYPLQSELNGKTVGILGLGRIGKEIAVRCQAMKMRVVYHGRRKQLNQPFVYYDDLIDMARDVDWLVVIAPGGKGTEKIVSREVLQALGPKGFLVNVARGTLVDEAALLDMLQKREIAGAALDVFEKEPQMSPGFFTLDNVVLSPHAGSATHQTRFAMGDLVVRNLEAWFAGDPLLTPVV